MNLGILDKNLAKSESQFAANNFGTVTVKWKDTKEVSLMSNCHKYTIEKTYRRQTDGTKKKVSCPSPFVFYNEYMGGVDRSDQTCSDYSFERKSNKWWKKVFYSLLKISVVNAWIVFSIIRCEKFSKFAFLVYLMEQMLEEGRTLTTNKYIRKSGQGQPLKRKRSDATTSRNNEAYYHFPKKIHTRIRCRGCLLKGIKEKRTNMICRQ